MMLTRSARVITTATDGVLLFVSMTGTEALGRPFEFDLEMLAAHERMDLSGVLGKPMTVQLEMMDGGIREFNGIVTSFSLAGEMGRHVRYRATLRPWLWLLTRRTNCRIFQHMSVPDMLKQMFREHEFTDVESRLTGDYRTWEYLVQYRESDFNFVSRMMEQEGIYYYFTHTTDAHTLILADSYSAHEPIPNYGTVPYFPPIETQRRERDYIDHWRPRHRITSGAFYATDYDFERPKAGLFDTAVDPAEYNYSRYELYDYPGEFRDASEAKTQVKIRLEEEQVEHDLAHGAGTARGVQSGALMTLADFPREDQNKEYLILSVTHELRIDTYESIQNDGENPEYRCRFVAMDSKRPYRAPRFTRKPVVEGPQTAEVVGKEGEEIWTDKYGRIKVQFHWDREGERNEDSSCWVRVAQLWAGSGFGGMHIPRMGQEVLVDFLEGDPDKPVVVGRLYNADNMPPYDLPDNQTQSGIKSRSTKGATPQNFNEIRMEDKKGEEELYIQAEKNMTTLVKNDENKTVLGSISVTIGKPDQPSSPDRTSSMNIKGKHSMDASDTMSLQAPNSVTITCGGSSITLTPDRIVIKAGGGTEIAMDANGRFESSQASKLFLDANAKLESSGGSSVLFDANAYMEASGGGNVLFDANVNMMSAAGDQVLLDGKANITGVSAVEVGAPKISCTADAEIGLTVGGQSVKLTPASVDVAGATINCNGTGMVVIGGPMIKIG